MFQVERAEVGVSGLGQRVTSGVVFIVERNVTSRGIFRSWRIRMVTCILGKARRRRRVMRHRRHWWCQVENRRKVGL
jgi:hypothetical protein